MMDRWPYPFIEMNPDDMSELEVAAGDLVEVYNDNGSTQAMVYPTPTAKRKADLHAVRLSNRRAGQRRLAGRERAIIPNYKQTWANIRKLASAPESVKHRASRPRNTRRAHLLSTGDRRSPHWLAGIAS